MKIPKRFFRLTLFRLEPKILFEIELIKRIQENFKEVAFFQLLGKYDLACIYPSSSDHKILYNGSIKGIRSFSSIDCVCWGGGGETSRAINSIKDARIISIVNSCANEKILPRNNGVCCSLFRNAIGKKGLYLNSLSWGEQVAIFKGPKNFSTLWKNTHEYISKTKKYAYDTNAFFGINYELINLLKDDPKNWDEKISNLFSIFWKADLKSKEHSLEEFHEKITQRLSSFDFEFHTMKKSITDSEISYNIKGGTWGNLLNAIKSIRNDASELMLSSRLNIYQNDRLI